MNQMTVEVLRPAILRPARTETITTEHGSSRRRFEGHAVRLAALVADDLKLLAFRSSGSLARSKVRAALIATGFAALRMAQVALAIVFLFSFTKREGISAFGASDFKIWHRYLPTDILRFSCVSFRRVYSTSACLYSKCPWSLQCGGKRSATPL